MLKYRLTFGAAMIAMLLGIVYLDAHLDQVDTTGTFVQRLLLGRTNLPAGLLLLLAGLLVVPLLASRELGAIFRAKNIPTDQPMITLSAVVGFLVIYVMPSGLDSQRAMALLATLAIALFLVALVRHSYRRQRTEGAVAAGGAVMLAMTYLGILPGFFILIRRWHSAWIVLAIIMVTKCCDSGAYFTGRMIGRRKLIPWLSPGKTWEGLFGGLVASVVTAVILAAIGNHLQPLDPASPIHLIGRLEKSAGHSAFLPTHYPLWLVAIFGLVIGLVSQFGDLTASLFKRDAGIKDSGSLLPGFGGLIDIIDSPIVVAPVAYWLLAIMDATR